MLDKQEVHQIRQTILEAAQFLRDTADKPKTRTIYQYNEMLIGMRDYQTVYIMDSIVERNRMKALEQAGLKGWQLVEIGRTKMIFMRAIEEEIDNE